MESTDTIKSGEIILITSTVVTLLISLLDVIINAFAHTRDRKLNISLCKDCSFNYESSEEETPPAHNILKETV